MKTGLTAFSNRCRPYWNLFIPPGLSRWPTNRRVYRLLSRSSLLALETTWIGKGFTKNFLKEQLANLHSRKQRYWVRAEIDNLKSDGAFESRVYCGSSEVDD